MSRLDEVGEADGVTQLEQVGRFREVEGGLGGHAQDDDPVGSIDDVGGGSREPPGREELVLEVDDQPPLTGHLDGQKGFVPEPDAALGVRLQATRPEPGRVAAVARRIAAWVRLGAAPVAERRVAKDNF